MTGDAQEETLAPVDRSVQPARPPKPTRREERRRRRKARRRGEEILAWVLVPLILMGLYWGVTAGFEVMGTTPGTVWDQLMQVKAALQKKA